MCIKRIEFVVSILESTNYKLGVKSFMKETTAGQTLEDVGKTSGEAPGDESDQNRLEDCERRHALWNGLFLSRDGK